MSALALAAVLALAAQGAAEDDDCGATTGATALIDLGRGTYEGHEGGLYPGGSNESPPEHLAAALERAADVRPRDRAGRPDDERGSIAMLSLGMSSAAHAFARFERDQDENPGRNPRLVLVNGAQPGWSAEVMVDPERAEWDLVDRRLEAAGVSREQVQVVWLQQRRAPAYHRRMAALEAGRRGGGRRTGRDPSPPRSGRDEGVGAEEGAPAGSPQRSFPAHAELLRDELDAICRLLPQRFPNLALCYVSDLPFGRYGKGDRTEPWTYELGFAVKWLIEQQLGGSPGVELGPARRAPLLLWGPYFWADGARPNGRGTRWCRRDFETDGTHPSESGEAKLSSLLGRFLETEPTAAPWFANPGGPGLRVVEASADTHLFSDRPEVAFGGEERLRLGGGVARATAFVRFVLPTLDRPVLQARLSVRNPTTTVRYPELSVYAVELGDWDESTPLLADLELLGDPVGRLPESSRDVCRTLDLTELVNARLGRTLTLALAAPEEATDSTQLRSREAGDGPRLVLVPAGP